MDTQVELEKVASDAFDQGFEAGLTEAKRRLGLGGFHDGRCPEPDRPCTCGIDLAIDIVYPPGATPIWRSEHSN